VLNENGLFHQIPIVVQALFKGDFLMSDKKITRYNNEIAIIGMACRFPGANNYNEFWENLKNGVNSIKEISPERWDINKYYSPDINEPNKSISKWCGLVDDFDKFDNGFFNISPREAAHMDPQQRLLLEATWHCIEDSGMPLKRLQKKKTSVYVGVMAIDYHQEIAAANAETDSYTAAGNYESMLANRISFVFGLKGQSMSIDAACASSLVALHEAGLSLTHSKSDYAIAAGVSLNFHPFKYISFSKSGMLSPDGKCKTFDKDANGYVPGDGVGVLLLQRLEYAVKQNATIYGIIKGSAVNHTGNSLSLTSPSVEAQKEVLISAFDNAKINPETISYIEAHGTGTSLGDPIELEALSNAFQQYTNKKTFCKIGSVKTNIGHLEAAAGMGGMIKVLMMIKHKQIPESLNLNTPNPVINFEDSPFSVATELSKWKNKNEKIPLRAGISSLGFGGVNSHIVLEQPHVQYDQKTDISEPFLFLLSAKSEKSLQSLVNQWQAFIKTSKYHSYNLSDISKTLATGRVSFPYRYGFPLNTKNEVEQFLKQTTRNFHTSGAKQICLIAGDFSLTGFTDIEYFFRQYPVLWKHLDKLIKLLSPKIRQIFTEKIWNSEKQELCSFITGCAYYNTLKDMGIAPDMLTGKGIGIWVSLVVSGMLTFKEAVSVLERQKAPEKIKLSRPDILYYDPVGKKSIMPYKFDETYLLTLISELDIGKKAFDYYISKARLLMQSQFTFKKFIEEWSDILEAKGKEISIMLHEESVQGLSEKERILILAIVVWALFKLNRKWNLKEERKVKDQRFYELADLAIDEVLSKDEFVGLFMSDAPDIADTVRILNRRQKRINPDRPYALLKKHQAFDGIKDISGWIKAALKAKASIPADENLLFFELGKCENHTDNSIRIWDCKDETFKKGLLELWLNGVDIDFTKLYPDGTFQKTPLPVYRFKGERHWIPRYENMQYNQESEIRNLKPLHPLIDRNISTLHEQKFTSQFSGKKFYLSDHVLSGKKTLPGVAYIEMAYAAGHLAGIKSISGIKNIVWAQAVVIEDQVQNVEISLYPNENKIEYEVSIAGEEGRRLICSQGKLLIDESVNGAISKHAGMNNIRPQIDIGVIKNRCKNKRYKKELYTFFEKAGFEYGLGFQVIEELFYGDSEALSLITLPSHLKDGFDNFTLHPSLMDGALQTSIWLTQNNENKGQFLPFSLGSMDIIRPLYKECYVYVKALKNRSIKTFDIQLFDTSGNVLIQMSDFTVRDTAGAEASSKATIDFEKEYHENIIEKEATDEAIDEQNLLFEVRKKIIKQVSEILKDDEEEIDLNSDVSDYGFNSMTLTELINRINEIYGLELMPALFFEHPTLGSFTKFLCTEHKVSMTRQHKVPSPIYPVEKEQYRIPYEISNVKSENMQYNQESEIRDIKLSNNIESLYFKPVWEKDRTEQKDRESKVLYDSVVIFDTGEKLYNEINKTNEKTAFVLVKPGKKYRENRKTGKQRSIIYEINPENKKDYQKLVRSFYKKDITPDKIVWFWSKGVSEDDNIDKQLSLGIYALFYFTQAALMEKKPKDKVKLLYACSSSPFHQAISGFAKTVHMENSKFIYSTIEFEDLSDAKSVYEKLTDEFQTDGADVEVRYESGQRWVKSFKEFDIEENIKGLSIRKNGIYLITGGMGGLGLIFARYLLENYKANIVLAGRSELDSEKTSIISDLNKSEAKILYLQADISKYDDVKRLIVEAKSEFGKIDGIIHCAGVIKDSFIIKKTKEEIDAVLAPKVHSVINLDKAAIDEQLDFFVMFSSTSGVLGNLAQCDYAYANSFMDRFADLRENLRKKGRRFGKTISINWPLWKEGGMQLEEQSEKLLAGTTGMRALDTETGLYAFEKALTLDSGQFVVLKGNVRKIRELFNTDKSIRKKESETDINTDKTELLDKVNKQVSKIISGILKTKEEDINLDMDVNDFGFDSITLTEFVNHINKIYDLNINPMIFSEYPSLDSFVSYLVSQRK
jgi:acyl transferase domain-containing protein/NADP-dependent 3-hydroxy acid dehydrogenase YdfG